MPGPTGRSDWGLTVDTLLALYATGVGEAAAKRIESRLRANAGAYLGPDLYRDPDVRLGGSAAALLVAAVVTGSDPHSFGHGRYAPAGSAYDLRAEVLDLIAPPRSDQRGRIEDHGTGGDSTNTFSQALAVVGLARSGGGHRPALEFLLTQQCRGGYFRMFYNDGRTCDRAHGRPDVDGTAIALEALVTARAHGSPGLRGPIARARGWLQGAQRPDGSFGGVGSSEPPNANSTGLAARALHSTGARGAYRRARHWVARLQVRPRTDVGALGAEAGAVAYDPGAFAAGRRTGIDRIQRDQWRRSTAQAVFALAPTSLARLGVVDPQGNPSVPQPAPESTPPDRDTTPPDRDDTEDGPGDQPPPDDPAPDDPPERDDDSAEEQPSDEPHDDPSPTATPQARLGGYIAGRLVDGTHVEVRDDGGRYVDYDRTADAVLALRILGERPDVARQATGFLLEDESVAAYAHGAPYEQGGAYAEPLAKLSLLAHWLPGADGERTAGSLAADLAALQNHAGGFADAGERPDRSMATDRQVWAALALRAAGRDVEAGAATDALLGVQCVDGGFASDLSQKGCEVGDPTSTGLAVQAVNAAVAGATTTAAYTETADGPVAPVADDALVRAARFLDRSSASGDSVAASAGAADWPELAALAAGRQAVGLDATYLAPRVVAAMHRDGGLGTTADRNEPSDLALSVAAAPALAGRSVLGAPGSPLTAATRVPVGPVQQTQRPVRQAEQATEEQAALPAWALYALAGLLALVLVLAAILLTIRIVRPGRAAGA